MHPNGDWYQAAGLAVIGWALLTIVARFAVHQSVQEWWAWGWSILGGICELVAGTYLARTGFIKGIVHFIQHSPLISFIVFILVLVGFIKLVAAATPTQVHGAALTSALAVFALLLPSSVNFIPGTAGQQARQAICDVSKPVADQTGGWFSGARGGCS